MVAAGSQVHPVVVALAVAGRGRPLLVPIADTAALVTSAISLKVSKASIKPYVPGEGDLFLAATCWTSRSSTPTACAWCGSTTWSWRASTATSTWPTSTSAAWGCCGAWAWPGRRRSWPAAWAARYRPGIISWDDVELLPGDQPMRLKVPGDKIADLHPADLAEIISDLSRAESSKLLESLDVETVADTLEEVEPDFQASLVETMPDEKVADVLEEMAPDEAADLLAELPEERSEELLNLMEREEAEDVRKLLAYPEDSAGGIMTTEFVAVRPDLTAEQAIADLRETADEAETIFYVYVTDEREPPGRGLLAAGPGPGPARDAGRRVHARSAWSAST